MKTGSFSKTSFGFLAASHVIPLVAYSQVYLSEDQALHAIFPAFKLTKKTITLTPEEIKKIENQSGERVRNPSLTLWTNTKKDVLFVDQVLGKHEFITYAVGISDQKIRGIEIMDYRETYGQGVIRPEWKNQFIGKTAAAPLKLTQDIVNISGGTLSSAHVTSGIRRLLRTYEIIRDRL